MSGIGKTRLSQFHEQVPINVQSLIGSAEMG